MQKLITFAVDLMEKENVNVLDTPSKNSILNPSLNKFLNPNKEKTLNLLTNSKINPKENPKYWRQCQLEALRETPIWEYMTKKQKLKCLVYLKTLK